MVSKIRTQGRILPGQQKPSTIKSGLQGREGFRNRRQKVLQQGRNDMGKRNLGSGVLAKLRRDLKRQEQKKRGGVGG